MTRGTILALLLVSAALAAVVGGVVHLARRDRAALVADFSAEQLGRIQEAANQIAAELGDIGENLRFAGELVRAAESPADRERELRALLATVKQYRFVAVYGAGGQVALEVTDPLAEPPFDARPYRSAMDDAARAALDAPGTLYTSRSVDADAGDWHRAVALSLPRNDDGRANGAVVVLVDTARYFVPLQLAAPFAGAILLGPHGMPAPATTPACAAAIRAADPRLPVLGALAARMRAGADGTVRLPTGEAAALGLPGADAIAAFAPVRGGGNEWSIATVSSLSALRAQERALLLRLGLASGAIAICLLAFAGYVVVASRRAIAVRERLRHADELADLHEKTEKILDNVPGGVMTLSADGRVTALNRVLRERLGEAALGKPLAAALSAAPAEVVAQLDGLLAGARAAGRVRSLFGARLGLFGREGSYSIHAVPIEPRFADAHALLVIEDVSEVYSLSSQLMRAEKLATVGVLAAGIAHEIGTPLGVVRARAELVAGKLGPEHPQTAGATVIIEQIDRVARTIRQLLDFARRKPADVSAVAVGPAARSVVELLRFEAERRRVRLVTELPDTLPPVAADPDQLQQVLVNLVLNACDACDGGGRVCVEARAPEPGGDQEPPLVRIEISDDGCGIAPGLRHQVFDPFFTTKKRGRGTGLGLTVVAQIVRSHGGTIDLDSEPGRGTRVILGWPAAAVDSERVHELSA